MNCDQEPESFILFGNFCDTYMCTTALLAFCFCKGGSCVMLVLFAEKRRSERERKHKLGNLHFGSLMSSFLLGHAQARYKMPINSWLLFRSYIPYIEFAHLSHCLLLVVFMHSGFFFHLCRLTREWHWLELQISSLAWFYMKSNYYTYLCLSLIKNCFNSIHMEIETVPFVLVWKIVCNLCGAQVFAVKTF